MNMRIAPLLALIVSLVIGGQAQAHKTLPASGSYDARFLRADFVAQENGVLYLDVLVEAQFELTIGGEYRAGTFTWPHIAKLDTSVPEGITRGGVVWVFNDGLKCVGFLGGDLVPPGPKLRGRGKFECSDGSTLILKVRDTSVEPGVGTEGDLRGILVAHDEPGRRRKHD